MSIATRETVQLRYNTQARHTKVVRNSEDIAVLYYSLPSDEWHIWWFDEQMEHTFRTEDEAYNNIRERYDVEQWIPTGNILNHFSKRDIHDSIVSYLLKA